jgi:hypothetical protein
LPNHFLHSPTNERVKFPGVFLLNLKNGVLLIINNSRHSHAENTHTHTHTAKKVFVCVLFVVCVCVCCRLDRRCDIFWISWGLGLSSSLE